jgi:hypothetical protein
MPDFGHKPTDSSPLRIMSVASFSGLRPFGRKFPLNKEESLLLRIPEIGYFKFFFAFGVDFVFL